MKPPAYPKYKPSGIEWLGDVPEHWEVKRLSYLATLNSGENITSEMIAEGGDYPVFGGNGLRGNYHKFTHRGHHALIGRQGALCGNINYASGEFYASEHALVVSPLKEFAVVWMGELLRAMNLGQFSVTAAQPGISAEMIRGLRIPVPPLPEQRAIAAFLDRETGRVDRLVAKKRELIERLKEKRTALISRTVTRGLPAEAAAKAGLPVNPPLKPSGLDWLGDIPAHWEALTVRRRAKRIQTGGTPATAEERYYEDGTVPWFGPSSFDDRIVVSEPVKLLNASAVKEGVARMFAVGATMVVTIGATLGKVSSLTEAGSCNQQITVIEFDQRRIHPRFATYQLKRLEPALRAIAPSATLPILDQGEVSDIALGVPPLPEQAAIAAYLDTETAKLDALVGKVEAAVERLQEYRTALITAAVTGKIDVRKEVAA